MPTIKLTIDGQKVTAEPGMTVLEAARQAGIYIPTVCAHEDLPDFGACRVCIVEIDGIRGYPTSCTTPAQEGMIVRTKTDELESLRNRVLELMMSGHPSACLVCDDRELCEKYRPGETKAGRTTRCGFCSNRSSCSVRQMVIEGDSRQLNLPTIYSFHNLQRDDPFMDRDLNLCILCGRCWRICEKIHGKPAISVTNRGRWARVGNAFHRSYVDSGCTFCGACIDICPTGTLTDRYARWYGKPDAESLSTCVICPEGCSLSQQTHGKQLVAARMTAFNRQARLCAGGRFAYAQLVGAPARLRQPIIEEGGEQIPVGWEEALATVAEKLKAYQGGGQFVAIVGESETRETRFLYEKFATEVMGGRVARVPAAGGFEQIEPESLKQEILSGRFGAALATGDYLDPAARDKIEYLVVADFLPSAIGEAADAVFPAAVLSEAEGTFRNAAGEVKTLGPCTPPPGEARAEWTVIRDLARAMGAEGFDYETIGDVTADIEGDPAPAPLEGSPRDNLADLPPRFRGHPIADVVPALEAMGLPASEAKPAAETTDGFLVLQKREVAPNFHRLEIEAPQVPRNAKPGQFVILMVKETSERTPFTLIDWDADRGTITLVVEEVGRSSREVVNLQQGDRIAHVTGPLGLPFPIEKVGTVVLGGGCYGIGGIYPIARAMKEAGNRVICVLEASSHYLFYMIDRFQDAFDELLLVSKDGSRGSKGSVQKAFVDLVEGGTQVDTFVAIGCTFMMRMVAEATEPYDVPLWVALNPIMIDGTGMCGACRVSIGGETKFACVDGPIFDGHQVDWDELFARRGAFVKEEIQALPQHAASGAGCHVDLS